MRQLLLIENGRILKINEFIVGEVWHGADALLSVLSTSPYGDTGRGGKTQVSEGKHLNKPGRF